MLVLLGLQRYRSAVTLTTLGMHHIWTIWGKGKTPLVSESNSVKTGTVHARSSVATVNQPAKMGNNLRQTATLHDRHQVTFFRKERSKRSIIVILFEAGNRILGQW